MTQMVSLLRLFLPTVFLLLVSCVDVEQFIDLSVKSKPYLYTRVTYSVKSPEWRRTESHIVRLLGSYSGITSNFIFKKTNDGDLRIREWEGPFASSLYSETLFRPELGSNFICVTMPIIGTGSETETEKSNVYRATLLGSNKYRLSLKTAVGDNVKSAELILSGIRKTVKVSKLKDYDVIEIPMSEFAGAYKKVSLQINFYDNSSSLTTADDDAKEIGLLIQKGIIAFDQNDFLKAHGIFARLYHEKRIQSGDLFFYYGFTASIIDKDPSLSRGMYVLALDWFRKNTSDWPWEHNEDRAYLMLGLLYGDPTSKVYDKNLAKQTFDAGLKRNPNNLYIKNLYDKVVNGK